MARDPGRISALEVIHVIDGPVGLTSCVDRTCEQSERCTVREPLRRVHEGLLDLLAGITITDMAAEGRLYGIEERRPGLRRP